MSEKRCLDCAYLELTPETAASGDGICHLNPPTTALVNGPQGAKAIIVQHMVKATASWCSHHELQLVKPASKLEVVKEAKK